MEAQRPSPPVDLELPIVSELMVQYGNSIISYTTMSGENKEATVAVAFRECGDLSELGRLSPDALRMAIEDSVARSQSAT